MIANYIHQELGVMKQSPNMVVFLKDGLADSEIESIRKRIRSLPQVNSAKYVSKEDALRKTKEMFAGREQILEGLEDRNPLPSSFDIELKSDFLDDAKMVVGQLSALPGVDDVQYAEKTSQLIQNIETSLIFVGSILGLASVVIVCFSIMLTTYLRREEIRIMRLVGATGLFIRIPLLLQGIMQGLIGSVLGLAILYGLLLLLSMRIGPISFLPVRQIILVIAIGAFMGFVGGAVPLRRLIRI